MLTFFHFTVIFFFAALGFEIFTAGKSTISLVAFTAGAVGDTAGVDGVTGTTDGVSFGIAFDEPSLIAPHTEQCMD